MATRSKNMALVASNEREGSGRVAAYEQIKDAILAGVLRPLERITEEGVADRLGLSRTPVREAFGFLASEGLIVIVPKRGSFVSQLTVGDILEIYQIRMPLECMAAGIAAEVLSDAQLDELEHLVRVERERGKARSPQDSLAASAQFHDTIIGCIHNKRLSALLKQMQGQVHRARALWPSTISRLSDTWEEHEALLKALRARDANASERLMREHLERAQTVTLSGMMPKRR